MEFVIKETIAALKAAGKSVWMLYFNAHDVDWPSVIGSNNITVLDKFLAPTLTHVSQTQLDGIILAYLNLLVSYFTIIYNIPISFCNYLNSIKSYIHLKCMLKLINISIKSTS